MDARPSPWKLLSSVAAATAASWLVLWLNLPWLQALPGWFWPLTDAPRPQPIWIAVALLLFGVSAWLATRPGRGRWAAACLLVTLGVGLQWCFALTEGRGHQALRDRMIVSGHAALMHEAVARNAAGDGLLQIARSYPERVERGELPVYPFATKPAGALLVYMMHERLTALWPNRHGDREARAVTSATLVFPLLAASVVLPLLGLAAGLRLRAPPSAALAALYWSIPAVLLVTLHLDQALFPLLAALVIWPCAASLGSDGRGGLALAAAAGALAAAACFASYALVAVLALGVLVLAWHLPQRSAWQRLAAFGGGAVLALAGLRTAVGFDLLRGLDAVNRHREWKIRHWDPGTTLSVGLVDLVELAMWTGPPIFVLACLGCARGARRRWQLRATPRETSPADSVAVAVAVVVLLLAFAGRTVGEVARLWLFLQPAISLVAARELARQTEPLDPPAARLAWGLVVAVQLLHTGALKLWMDFV